VGFSKWIQEERASFYRKCPCQICQHLANKIEEEDMDKRIKTAKKQIDDKLKATQKTEKKEFSGLLKEDHKLDKKRDNLEKEVKSLKKK